MLPGLQQQHQVRGCQRHKDGVGAQRPDGAPPEGRYSHLRPRLPVMHWFTVMTCITADVSDPCNQVRTAVTSFVKHAMLVSGLKLD